MSTHVLPVTTHQAATTACFADGALKKRIWFDRHGDAFWETNAHAQPGSITPSPTTVNVCPKSYEYNAPNARTMA
jgi:hypothetical protein